MIAPGGRFLLALAIGLLLTGAAIALMLWVLSGRASSDGNVSFGIFVFALLLLVLGLPLVTNLAVGRRWFTGAETGGPEIATAETLLAEEPSGGAITGALLPTEAPVPQGILLSVRGLKKHFPILGGVLRRQIGTVYAVDGVDFDVRAGEVFSLVGESGCGKTTLGRTVLQLTPPTAGRVVFDGYELGDVDDDDMRPLRRRMQIIFQDPFGSLNPRMPVSDIIGEGLFAQGVRDRKERDKRVEDALEIVGLRRDYTRRYPHEFSGGQRQRIGVARALALNPDLIVCDEPVSALDVSIQSQVLNLLLDLQRRLQPDVPVHQPQPLGRRSTSATGSGSCTSARSSRAARSSSSTRSAPSVHGGPAVGHPRTRTRGSAASASSSRATCRRRPRRRPAVASTPAAGSGSSSATRRSARPTEPELRAIGGGHRSACHFAEEISEIGRPGDCRRPVRGGDGRRRMRSSSGLRGGGAVQSAARRRLRLAVPAILVAVTILALAVACSPEGSATGSPGSTVEASGGPTPKPTTWPTGTVEATIALGAANGEFTKMTDDIAAAVDSQDPARIATAMNDALTFLTGNQQNIGKLQDYPGTKELGDRLAPVYAKMIAGATQVRGGLTSGDAGAVEAGFTTFFEGSTEYAELSSDVATAAEQAVLMKRQLLN